MASIASSEAERRLVPEDSVPAHADGANEAAEAENARLVLFIHVEELKAQMTSAEKRWGSVNVPVGTSRCVRTGLGFHEEIVANRFFWCMIRARRASEVLRGWPLPRKGPGSPAHRPQRQATLVFLQKADCQKRLRTTDAVLHFPHQWR